MASELPESFDDERELDEFLTRPSNRLLEAMHSFPNRLVVLGAGGKMGPSLAVRAHRAAQLAGRDVSVTAVSRFTNNASREWLEARGVRTISCDLLERDQTGLLPDADGIIYLVGRKFGTSANPHLTWAMNTIPVFHSMERYAGVPFVALSTGCVYPFVDVSSNGSRESDPLTPVGEYANSCVARERLFEHLSRKWNTPVLQVRLNYALDLRYGVLVDIAQAIIEHGRVDLSMGWFNGIWQGDANDAILRLLGHATVPPTAINVTGPERASVRDVAGTIARVMNRPLSLLGKEGDKALLSDSRRACELVGRPSVPLNVVVKWTAKWILQGGSTLGTPTRFQAVSGDF